MFNTQLFRRLRAQKHLQLRQRLFGRFLGEEMSPGKGLAGHFHRGARLPGGDDVEHPPGVSAVRPECQPAAATAAVAAVY